MVKRKFLPAIVYDFLSYVANPPENPELGIFIKNNFTKTFIIVCTNCGNTNQNRIKFNKKSISCLECGNREDLVK